MPLENAAIESGVSKRLAKQPPDISSQWMDDDGNNDWQRRESLRQFGIADEVRRQIASGR
jgi:hypothetical protein